MFPRAGLREVGPRRGAGNAVVPAPLGTARLWRCPRGRDRAGMEPCPELGARSRAMLTTCGPPLVFQGALTTAFHIYFLIFWLEVAVLQFNAAYLNGTLHLF